MVSWRAVLEGSGLVEEFCSPGNKSMLACVKNRMMIKETPSLIPSSKICLVFFFFFLVELNIYSCTVASKRYGRNKQVVERENKNNWSYGTRVIWKEMENTKPFYFREDWIRRDMIKGSEEMNVIEKVDKENYSLFFLILKKENTQQNGKNENSKIKKKK